MPTSVGALQNRVCGELASFGDWTRKWGVQGFIGEIGLVENRYEGNTWAVAGKRWFEVADQYGLFVTGFSVASAFSQSGQYPLYTSSGGLYTSAADQRGTVSRMHEVATHGRLLRGCDLAGGTGSAPSTAATSTFSNANPGVYGSGYAFEPVASLNYLVGLGHNVFRVGFRWERIQPTLGAALDATELARVSALADRARSLGVSIILDCHNYGSYYLDNAGTGERKTLNDGTLTVAHFNDLWARLSAAFASHTGVVAYGLMNEPNTLTAGSSPVKASAILNWEYCSAQAAATIRGLGDSKAIIGSGYSDSNGGSPVVSFASLHAAGPWLGVSGASWYEAHHYWNSQSSSVAPANALSASSGWVDPSGRSAKTGVPSAFDARVDAGVEFQRIVRS